MQNNDKKRTRNEEQEYQEGLKNPNGFRSKMFGSAEEISAFEDGQRDAKGKNAADKGEESKDDLERKR